jgi:hypothetical protein
MPIPGMDNSSFYYKAGWEYKFSLWPRRCLISNKVIWLKYAYKGTAMWTGPGTPAYQYQWHDATEHLIWKLKGN